MENIVIFLIDNWTWLSIIFSTYWGIRVVRLEYVNRLNAIAEGAQNTLSLFDHLLWESIYNFIFHFVGSMAGWCCFNVLLMRVRDQLYTPIPICTAVQYFRGFNSGDLLLFIIALLGVTGHLPQSLYGLVKSLSKLAEAAVNKISG